MCFSIEIVFFLKAEGTGYKAQPIKACCNNKRAYCDNTEQTKQENLAPFQRFNVDVDTSVPKQGS